MRPVRRWRPNPSPPPDARAARRQRLPSWLVLAVVGVIAWAYSQWNKPAHNAGTGSASGDVITGTARVTDGDSLSVGNMRIRLFGIDAPEARQLCKDAAGEDTTCGLAAREALAGLTGDRQVSCTPAEGPSYDRVVAVCTVDGANNGKVDLSEAMVRAGRAIELKAHSKGRYAAAERAAREAQRGLWAGTFERPSQWRQRNGR